MSSTASLTQPPSDVQYRHERLISSCVGTSLRGSQNEVWICRIRRIADNAPYGYSIAMKTNMVFVISQWPDLAEAVRYFLREFWFLESDRSQPPCRISDESSVCTIGQVGRAWYTPARTLTYDEDDRLRVHQYASAIIAVTTYLLMVGDTPETAACLPVLDSEMASLRRKYPNKFYAIADAGAFTGPYDTFEHVSQYATHNHFQ